jgi:DNA-directed RNA polymerase specialized sigma24 family protein
VEVLRRYSNRRDLVKSVQEVLRRIEEGDQADDPGVESTGRGGRDVTPVRERLGEDKFRELVECRRSGMLLQEIATRYGISLSSVKRVVRRFESGE